MKKTNLIRLGALLDYFGTLDFNENYSLRIGLRVKGNLPKILQREFGGTVFELAGKNQWRVQGKNAERLLKRIMPYLRHRKRTAQKELEKYRNFR